jgi:S1-C subfamily serine protease
MRPMSVQNISVFVFLLAILPPSALISYQAVFAEDLLQIPKSELSIPGVVQKSSIDAPKISSATYADLSGAEALTMQFKDAVAHTRGPQDVSLFRRAAPAVVLILVKEGLGSGSLLQGNVILTNFHVVDHNREVTVVFKPTDPSGKATQDEVVKGDVVKVDVQRDLALVRPRSLPNHSVLPLEVSSQEIEVGADVRAIGHHNAKLFRATLR